MIHKSYVQFDPALRDILWAEWGIDEAPEPFSQGSTGLTWKVFTGEGPAVVKLSWDEIGHFLAGLRASQSVEAGGIVAGVPIASRSGKLVVHIENGQYIRPVALLRKVEGTPAPLEAMNVRFMGQLLARLHMSLSSCEATGAWTVADVVGHMRRGVLASHPSWAHQIVQSATHSVKVFYTTQRPHRQVIRGDGPEILLNMTGELAGVIDWGGVRFGSVADDIGCWTLYLGMLHSAYQETREEFLHGYTDVAPLTQEERAAIPLFQHLRLASRICYVTDQNALANIETWVLAWQAARQEEGW